MKRLRSLTLFLGVIGVGLSVWFFQEHDLSSSMNNPTEFFSRISRIAQGKTVEGGSDSGEFAEQIRQGNSLLNQSRMLLLHNMGPIQADVLQIIQTPTESFRATGQYWQAPEARSRMLLEMQIGVTSGRMLQVSNGQVIWSVRDIKAPEQKADLQASLLDRDREKHEQPRLKIERIDLQRIQEYATATNQLSAPAVQSMHGGIAGLLATLESHMDFRMVKQVTLNGDACFVLEGTWKHDSANRIEYDLAREAFLQARPDKVRLFIREADLFPLRYLCLKKHPEREGYYAPLAMEISDIQAKPNLDLSIFNYRPPEDQVPNDITHEYLSRLELAGKESDATVQ